MGEKRKIAPMSGLAAWIPTAETASDPMFGVDLPPSLPLGVRPPNYVEEEFEDVVCKCGCNDFKLSRGSYSLRRVCVSCGAQKEIDLG